MNNFIMRMATETCFLYIALFSRHDSQTIVTYSVFILLFALELGDGEHLFFRTVNKVLRNKKTRWG